MLVFPEGTKGTGKLYSERYRLRRFGRGGFVEIAMRAGVPVVPDHRRRQRGGDADRWPSPPALAKLLGVPYAPLTANMLLLGPLGLVCYFPAKFKLRVLDPVAFDVPAGPGALPAQPGVRGGGGHPAAHAGQPVRHAAATGAASGSGDTTWAGGF